MPRVKGIVPVGVVAAMAILAASPATAGRQVHGGDVARILAGKAFQIQCVDGTRGSGQFTPQGVVTVSYRRPNGRNGGAEENDHAVVRVRGVEICLSWKHFGGGGNACYPVHQHGAGQYRLGSDLIWCDINASK